MDSIDIPCLSIYRRRIMNSSRKKKYYFHLQPLEGFESASWFYYCQQTDFKNKNRKLITDGMKVCQDEGQAYDIKWDPYTGKPVANVCHLKFWKVAGRGTMFRLYHNASVHSSSFSKSCFQQGKHHSHMLSNFLCVSLALCMGCMPRPMLLCAQSLYTSFASGLFSISVQASNSSPRHRLAFFYILRPHCL